MHSPEGLAGCARRVGKVEGMAAGHLPAKVAKLEHALGHVEQQVLGLDIAMADASAVQVGQGTEHLVDGELQPSWVRGRESGAAGCRTAIVTVGSLIPHLDVKHRHLHLALGIALRKRAQGRGHKLHHQVEVDLVLKKRGQWQRQVGPCRW